ncbi:MAG: hypothetical protein LLG20_25415 [Acidobacteriales bacterium]|nr:hypothetical protein [Terriglobales bacterium]
MTHTWLIAAFVFWAGAGGEIPASIFNVMSHGTSGRGLVNDAPAIQAAIDACSRSGGGTVYFPAGDYLSGTIVLKSNVTLHLSPGAVLRGSRKMDDYNPPHLIYAQDAENIGIEGSGTINGNGDAYWEKDFKPKTKRPSPMIRLERCRRIRILDVNIRNTPGLGIYPSECDGVSIRGVSIVSDMRGPNTDGIDLASSRNVTISDSYIETGDDAICLKSHKQPCENITVTNCTLISDDSALKIGTGTYGGFRNCLFSNCAITGTRYGIGMYVKDGGVVEGIGFSNIQIDTSVAHYNRRTNSAREWIEYPIFVDLEKRTPESGLSLVRDITFSDIQIRTKGRILVEGMPERPIENLTFRNIAMRVTGFESVENLKKPRGVRGMAPASRELDYSTAPAALIFANIRGLRLRDIRVIWDTTAEPQNRHAVYASRIEDLFLAGLAGSPAGSGLATIGLDSVRRAFITQSRVNPGTAVFVGTRNTPAKEVVLTGNDLGDTRPMAAGATYQHFPTAASARHSRPQKQTLRIGKPSLRPLAH